MTKPFTGRIGIIGSGALGAFYGARLFKAGQDVHFLLRSDYDVVKEKGLAIKSFEGDFHINPPVYNSVESMGVCDFVLIGLKTTQNSVLPELLKPIVGPHTIVLTLQNGLGNEEAIADALGGGGARQIMGGISFICSNRTAPGVIHHIDHGQIRISEFGGEVGERAHAVAAMFAEAGIRCEVFESLLRLRWEKLVWNIPFNGLGVAAQANVAEVLASAELRKVARTLMLEAVATAEQGGTSLDPAIVDKMLRNSETMGPYRSSSQIDYESGNPVEVESLFGEPVRRGRAAGTAIPAMETLYAIIKHRDKKQRAEK